MCDDREKLIAYLYDEADAGERREIDAHLGTCDTCREELRGLRSARTDLLAWDVPASESVWKPFATPRVIPWWRQVPAWGMAAAATLVFGIGLAGGFAGRLLVSPAPVAVQARQSAMPVMTAGPNVSGLETRLTALERNGAARLEPVPVAHSVANQSPRMTAADYDALLARVQTVIDESEARHNQRSSQQLLKVYQDIETQRKRDVANLQDLIYSTGSRSDSNILRAMNARGTAEKEKEK